MKEREAAPGVEFTVVREIIAVDRETGEKHRVRNEISAPFDEDEGPACAWRITGPVEKAYMQPGADKLQALNLAIYSMRIITETCFTEYDLLEKDATPHRPAWR